MAHYVQTGVSLTRSQDQSIRALADKLGMTYSETIRNLVSTALPFAENGHSLNFGRIVTIVEFASVALDHLVQKMMPEASDHLLAEAIKNARQFHAS